MSNTELNAMDSSSSDVGVHEVPIPPDLRNEDFPTLPILNQGVSLTPEEVAIIVAMEKINFAQVIKEIDDNFDRNLVYKRYRDLGLLHTGALKLFTEGKVPSRIPLRIINDLSILVSKACEKFTCIVAASVIEDQGDKYCYADLNTDSDNAGFQKVQTKHKKRKTPPSRATETPLANKFAKLDGLEKNTPNNDVMSESLDSHDENDEESPSTRPKKVKPPPPIYWANIADPRKALKELETNIGHPIRGEMRGPDLKINPATSDEYRSIRKYLGTIEAKCHTYQLPEERNIRVVIRGLGHNFPINEITEELTEKGIVPIEVYQMPGKKDDEGMRKPMPLYQVVLPRTKESKEIYNLKYIGYLKVKIENQRKRKGIPQCYRCQGWGHTAKLCTRDAQCVKCGTGHLSKDCDVDEKQIPKCANCKGDHAASFTGCPRYPGNKKPAQFQAPSTNVWDERRKKRAAEEAARKSQAHGHILNQTVEAESEDEDFLSPTDIPRVNRWEEKLVMIKNFTGKLLKLHKNHPSYDYALRALAHVLDVFYD